MVSSGFRPERDFEIMGTGGGGPMIAAIDTGQVDAGMLITTDIENIMQKPGAYKVVIEYRDMPYASFGALVLQSWVKANPKDAAAFAKATVRAIEDLKKDPKFAVSVIQKMYPSFSPELAAAVAKSAVQRTPNGGIVSAASLENLNKIVTATDKSLTPVSLLAPLTLPLSGSGSRSARLPRSSPVQTGSRTSCWTESTSSFPMANSSPSSVRAAAGSPPCFA
jgi:NitT/TauT family transport system substrate-binding protein